MTEVFTPDRLTEFYSQDANSGVWTRKDSNPINYSDGAASEALLDRILSNAKDLSSNSQELRAAICDWPTNYHLSSYRSNLLRPLREDLLGTVLEIGAGCGAMTRYLGENAHTVLALEGSLERAKLCAKRCRDLKNVHVICEPFDRLQNVGIFDAVLLIGVLEYSKIFYDALNGPEKMLVQAVGLLSAQGTLHVAIENQLGLKYFAGALEDHIGKPWVSVGDIYPLRDAITFGRKELTQVIEKAGCSNLNFFIPLPDYKLPVSILNADGLEAARQCGFNPSIFASQSAANDPNGPDINTFPLETAWNVVERNGLLLELANSFLITARKSAPKMKDYIPVAYHYGAARKNEFSKETLLYVENNRLLAKRTAYINEKSKDNERFSVHWQNEEITKGKLLIEDLIYLVNREGWKIEDLAMWAKPWVDELCAAIESTKDSETNIMKGKLPANYLDATPFNLIRTPAGEMVFIDLEWLDTSGPSLAHVLVRGLISSFDRISSVAQPDTHLTSLSYLDLIKNLLEKLGLSLSEENLSEAIEAEKIFSTFVTDAPSQLSLKSLQHRQFRVRVTTSMKKLMKSLNALHAKIEVYESTNKGIASDISISKIKDFAELYGRTRALVIDQNDKIESIRQQKISNFLRYKIQNETQYKFEKAIVAKKDSRKRFLNLFLQPNCLTEIFNQNGLANLMQILKGWWQIEHSGLFDAEYYKRNNLTDANYKMDDILHYLYIGANKGLNPHPLFNAMWYTETYSLANDGTVNPLLHYITTGSKDYCNPHPLFDSRYYHTQAGSDDFQGQTALTHYLYSGWQAGLSAHPLFDPHWYLSQKSAAKIVGDPLSDYLQNWVYDTSNPNMFFENDYYITKNADVASSNTNPLVHFSLHGYLENRDPCPDFSVAAYLEMHSDIRNLQLDSLSHYLRYGIIEGRKSVSVATHHFQHLNTAINMNPGIGEKIAPPQIANDHWNNVPARINNTEGIIDVIIPVYKGKLETLACVYSVLNSPVQTAFRLLIINDQSPDEELVIKLRELATSNKIILIENQVNLGFVASVNKGMSYSKSSDIVLLNSDTEVFPDWLDRLKQNAYCREEIGTVTPLSNSATICSYPHFCFDRPEKLEIPAHTIDRLAAKLNKGQFTYTPTGIGFCMYIKRLCLAKTGFFDEEKFGHGYGEENDFCLRATGLGWKHAIAPDVYVVHYGSTSFGDEERTERVNKAMKIIGSEYPTYGQDVSEFIRRDPLLESRLRIDISRALMSIGENSFMFICHQRGGGTQKHMEQLAEDLSHKGVSVVYLEPHMEAKLRIGLRFAKLNSHDIPTLSAIDFNDKPELLASLLNCLNISHVHIHSLIDFETSTPQWLKTACMSANIPYDVTVHDYAWLCPRINMTGKDGIYCGGPEDAKCISCIAENGSLWGKIDVIQFRKHNYQLLMGARQVICPSQDVLARISRQFPEIKVKYKPHSCNLIKIEKSSREKLNRTVRRVAILGAVGAHKGSLILYNCVKDAFERKLPLEFRIVGYTDNQELLSNFPNVSWTGPYKDEDAVSTLINEDCDLCWFPAVWPETFSYTLNIALNAGVYPVTYGLGAPAERIKSIGWGAILDAELLRDAKGTNDALLQIDISSELSDNSLSNQFVEYREILSEYYNFQPL